jgi:hypothetical protein
MLLREKVRTTNFTTSKTKKNIEKPNYDHYIKKIYKSDQNVKKGKDQNIESVHLFSIKVIRTSKIENINYLWRITYGYQSLWGPGGLG